MARAQNTATLEDKLEELSVLEGEIVDESDALEHEQAVDSLLNELVGEDNVSVKVFRQPLKGRKLTYLFSCQPEDLSMDQIQDKLRDDYNGGDFRVQIRRDGKMVVNKPLSIERPSTIPGMETPKINADENTNSMQLFMMQMQEASKQQAADMQKMMMMQAQESNKMLLGIIQAISSKPNPEPPPQQNPLEMISAFAALKDAFTPPPDKTDKVDVLMKGIELAQGLSAGEANSSSVLQTAIKEVGGPLIEAAKLATAAQAAKQTYALPQKTTEPAPQTTIEKPADNPTAQTDKPTDEIAAALQPYEFYINSMIPLAKADADPQTYANMIIDQIGDEQAHKIFSQENAYEILAHYFPQIIECETWFRELIEIGKEITGPEEDEPLTNDGQHATIEPTVNDSITGDALQGDTTRATDDQSVITSESASAATIDPSASGSQSFASADANGSETGREGDQTDS